MDARVGADASRLRAITTMAKGINRAFRPTEHGNHEEKGRIGEDIGTDDKATKSEAHFSQRPRKVAAPVRYKPQMEATAMRRAPYCSWKAGCICILHVFG